MNKYFGFAIAVLSLASTLLAETQQNGSSPAIQATDTAQMTPEMETFNNQLNPMNPNNQVIFQSMTADKRNECLKAAQNNLQLTPDQVVDQVVKDLNTETSKVPSCCPVK